MPLAGTPPGHDEVEVSLFGPGYGECVLVHLGFDDWAIVDSCVNKATGRPAAIEYLSSIGVNANEAVKLVVATHWHDDHVRGIATVLRECENAFFACTSALNSREVVAVIELDDRITAQRLPRPVTQFREIFEIHRARKAATNRSIWRWADAGRTLFQRHEPFATRIQSLSPSDNTRLKAMDEIGRSLIAGQDKSIVPPAYPNYGSVALWVEVGDVRILLGADLENRPGSFEGWTAILDDPTVRPKDKAELFKVPHHGSPDAHEPRVWGELLVERPPALVSPWQWRGRERPQADDCQRICDLASELWATAPPQAPDSALLERFGRFGIGPRDLGEAHSGTGTVTFRRGVEEAANWRHDYVPPAYLACSAG